jgi:hypothetical protein
MCSLNSQLGLAGCGEQPICCLLHMHTLNFFAFAASRFGCSARNNLSRKLLAASYNSFVVVGFTSFLNFTMFVSISGEKTTPHQLATST